jgi:hypothetical protein
MIKIIAPGSYDFGEAMVSLIKLSSRGLRGNDLQAFIKRAGDEAAHRFKSLTFKPGEVPIHLIALGTTEAIGPNRNGDGFKCANCKRFHDTFVKYARYYRNHQNKDPKKSYGYVADSYFNDPMQRIELFCGWNGTKEAADRNGGLVADKEVDKLEKGDDIPVSMACKVAYDVCSGCHNHARNREEYCDAKKCVKYGGLKNNISRVFDDGHILHADNPEPAFFDISGVYRPADRIAYVLGKVANDAFSTVSGAKLAEDLGITAPFEVLSSVHAQPIAVQLSALRSLAEAEDRTRSMTKQASLGLKTEGSVFDSIEKPPVCSSRMYSVLKALHTEKIALSLPDFLALVGVKSELRDKVAADVADILPGVYSKMMDDPDIDDHLLRNPYRVTYSVASEADRRWASKLAGQFSLSEAHLQKRAWVDAIRQEGVDLSKTILTKTASTHQNETSEFFARQYALYKLAFLADMNETEDDLQLTADLLVRHNYTS